MYTKKILCLANSRKPPSGRCIAGKEIDGEHIGNWFRPVSARPGHEVSEEERRYENGVRAQLLDIVTIPFEKWAPFDHQVENHILDKNYYWAKVGVATWNQITSAADPYDPLFWGNSQSTYYGQNDKIAEADVIKAGSSLKLILVEDLNLHVSIEEGFRGNQGRRRVRATFTLHNTPYKLSVTDPEMEETYLKQADGKYRIGQSALCVSTVEVWNGFAFRVIASVITPSRCTELNEP